MSTPVAEYEFDTLTAPRTAPAHPHRPSKLLRLTWRGRVVVLLMLLALALGCFALFGSPAASTDGSASAASVKSAASRTVVVQPGQTLWDIATKAAPGQDPRQVIAEIVDLNSLSDAGSIRVGQPLLVPTD